jgi:hypothetical protein
MDDVSDIKGWAEKLDKTQNYSSIRGWKSLKAQWDKWFNPVGWSAERGYFEQLAWADQVIYHNSVVEGQCVFSWGHTSDVWEQFDISEGTEFQKLLEAYAAQGGDSQAAATAKTSAAPAATPVVTQPVVTQPVAFAASATTAASAATATAAVATQPVTSTNGQKTLQVTLTDDDAKVISTGLSSLSKVFADSTISAALQRLADVVAKANK